MKFPAGTRVRVLSSDLPVYVGRLGTVVDFDFDAPKDEEPLYGVVFDAPVGTTARDGFYEDELEAVL